MRHLPILVAVVLAVVVASPLDVETLRREVFLSEENARNSILEQLVLGLIEELRELMVNGSDTIPVLDPLKIDEIHVDENTIDIIPGHITIKDMTVNHLSTFEIEELSVTMTSLLLQRYRFIMDGSIPVLEVNSGGYDLNLSVFGGSIFGSGEASLRVVQPRIRTNMLMSIRLSGGIFLNLMECRISVSIGSFDPKITGMFNDPVISNFISAFLKNFIEEVFVFFEDDITELLSTTVMEIANQILADLDLAGILGV